MVRWHFHIEMGPWLLRVHIYTIFTKKIFITITDISRHKSNNLQSGLYGLYGPRCLPSPERPLNLITDLFTSVWMLMLMIISFKGILIITPNISVPTNYLNQRWFIVSWTFQWNLNQNMKIFVQQNSFFWVVICKMGAILFLPQCIKRD